MRCCLPLLALCLATPADKSRFDPMPVKVSSHGATACDGFAYVYGGHTGKMHTYSTETASGRFYRVPLAGGAWEELPGGPGLQGLALAAYKGKVIRVGGMEPRNKPGDKADTHSVASVGVYDPKAKAWAKLPDLPEGRSSHDAVVVSDRLVVVGGWRMQGAKAPVWHAQALSLDLSKPEAKWEAIDQPFRRRALSAVALGGKVYVIGGLTEDGMSKQVDILDPQTGKWSRGPEIPGPAGNGFSPAACVVGEQLVVSGADGKVHRLADRWEQVGTQAVKRMVHRIVAGKDGVVLVLGGNSADDARPVEEIRPGS